MLGLSPFDFSEILLGPLLQWYNSFSDVVPWSSLILEAFLNVEITLRFGGLKDIAENPHISLELSE